jgi:hypothetical protein
MLVVLSLIAICSVGAQAKSKTYTFGLEDASGTGEYCNYLTWSTYGTNNSLGYGTDNLTSSCGSAEDATLVGEKGSVTAAAGIGVSAVGFALATNENDVYTNSNSGYANQYVTGTKPGQTWIAFIASAPSVGNIYTLNYGTLSNTVPSGSSATHKNAAAIK